MTQAYRLPTGGRIRRDQPLSFEFNGQTFQGMAGDTLASALLANGVHFVARSFKYHRPRGIVSAGVEEPNALVQLETGPHTIPNARATEVELYAGLKAVSVAVGPGLQRDPLAVLQRLARFIPAGFYYKTFMWPRSWWKKHYEKRIREAAGLGTAPREADPDRYDKCYAHCEVLVIGAGPAGLAAALAAGRAGRRVLLLDQLPEAGGSLLSTAETIDRVPADDWVRDTLAELAAMPEVRLLLRTTAFGYHDDHLVTACERRSDHLPLNERRGVRERLWRIRAQQVVLATGAHERPLVFGNNDLPGVMLASAVSAYIHRHAVLPGRRAVVFTNNDGAYQTALDLHQAGAEVTVVDPRVVSEGRLPGLVRAAGITVLHQAVVAQAGGRYRVAAVNLRPHRSGRGQLPATLDCDLLAVSGGWNPVIHLFAQSRGRARWCETRACLVPEQAIAGQHVAGAANGSFHLHDILAGGWAAGAAAAGSTLAYPEWEVQDEREDPLLALWLVSRGAAATRGAQQFIDTQNDVTVADILLAVREGYRDIQHVKRYTALGFGTDQGKLGNINGMAILADALDLPIAEVGTTTFRPNYTPVSFGVFAGRELGDHFEPVRKTCTYDWHAAQGAPFEDVGQWKRAHYYPQPGEDMAAAVRRECLAVREGVGLLDYSTLGKIDVRGPDALEFLERMYVNAWASLKPGQCRYGLMLDENGMIMDDGVNLRLADDHFILTTTTSGAARVLAWMERWLQTEWPGLKVYLTSITDQYAVATVAGPRSRAVLQAVCTDIDLDAEAFPFMSFRDGSIQGIPVRILRVSFSGELSYEVYAPANLGRALWEILMQAGEPHGITPYGTETMHVLRAEKGYIIVGQDTDGSQTPDDVGMGRMVSRRKDCIGQRSLLRSHTAGTGRKQLVGLLSEDPDVVLPEGAQILAAPSRDSIASMLGHVTSSYHSPALGRSIALALVIDGRARTDETLTVVLGEGRFMSARVTGTVFYDPEGERQHVA
ncbi:MAG: sarcosine oxidase subunit alpha family protein [Castellaniella sp.]